MWKRIYFLKKNKNLIKKITYKIFIINFLLILNIKKIKITTAK